MPVVLSPITLQPDDEKITLAILTKWWEGALISRERQEAEWREDLRTYNAVPRQKEKNFPWRGASNLIIPMKAIVTDSIVSRLHAAIFERERIFAAEFADPDAAQYKEVFEEVLDLECKNRINLERVSSLVEFDSVLFGTGFAKGSYRDERRVVRVPQMDGSANFQEIIDYYGPAIDHVPIEDLVLPGNAIALNGPQRCQAIHHRSRLRWDELETRKTSYGYNIKELETRTKGKGAEDTGSSDTSQEIKELREKLRGVETLRENTFEVVETWCYFPIHLLSRFPDRRVKIGEQTLTRDFVELVITWHPKSNTILRVLENWNEIGWRPFFALPYIRRSDSVYGIGVGRAINGMNEALDTVHNQRIDNATIANTRIWKARKNSMPRSTSIWPGKVLWLDNPKEDLMAEAHGDVYSSSRENELILRGYIELRTGINDYNLGREDPTGRYSATATSTQLLLREGTRKFDFVIKDWRLVFGEMATWLVSQFRQYGYHYQDFLMQELGPEKAINFMLALDAQSPQPTYAVYKFGLRCTSVSDTKQARMEDNMALMQVTEQIYSQILLLAGNITRGVDQNGLPFTDAQKVVAWDAIEAGLTLYDRVLNAYDIKDTANYTITKDNLKEVLLAGAQQGAAQNAAQMLLSAGGAIPPGAPEGGAGQPNPSAPGVGGSGPPQNPGQSQGPQGNS